MEENTVTTVETTEKAAKADKAEKKKEYKKIVFADKKTVAKQTVAVVTTSIFVGALIALLDVVMKFLLSFIL